VQHQWLILIYTKKKFEPHKNCKCFKCKKTISDNDLQKLSKISPQIKGILDKHNELITKYKCPNCENEHKLIKWKDRNEYYECQTNKCGYKICKKCKLPWNRQHKNLSCHEMELLYQDQKHYIYCDQGHISHNNSGTKSKPYRKCRMCSFPTCTRNHCYLCQVSFSSNIKYHDCGKTQNQRKVNKLYNQVVKVGGVL